MLSEEEKQAAKRASWYGREGWGDPHRPAHL